jgi:hypothetical protein
MAELVVPAAAPATPLQPATLPQQFAAAVEPAPAIADLGASRDHQHAANLLRQGVDVDRVKQAMAAAGHTNWTPDERTPAQASHDMAFDIPATIDPKIYSYSMGAAAGEFQDIAKVDSDMRGLAAGMALSPDIGSRFIAGLVSDIASGNRLDAAELAACIERNQSQIAELFPGDRLAVAKAAVDDFVTGLRLPNEALATALRFGGVLCSASRFVQLATRAAKISLWQSSRPK